MKNSTFIKQAFLSLILAFGFQYYLSAQIFVIDLPPGYNKVDSFNFEKGIDGSPWLSDTWDSGVIRTTNGKIVKGLKYRYNIYRNELYFQSNDEVYKISSPDSIVSLEMNDKKFVYLYSDPRNMGKKRFLEVAVDGVASLYINYYPDILPSNYNKALGTGNINSVLSIKQSYLIKVGNSLTLLDKKRTQFAVAFADKKAEIEAFIKQENTSFKERSDVEKVVKYYNSLK
jgi:hypothetical protein